MSRIPVTARIDDGNVKALVDGWVESGELTTTADGVGVRVEVERVRQIEVRRVGTLAFPESIVKTYMQGEYGEKEAGERLSRAWLEGSWPCLATPDEIRDRKVWPPPDAPALFDEEVS